MKTTTYKYYDIILALFVSVLLISNISAVKLVDIGPFIADGGAVLFPLAYIFGDILTEVYGFNAARRAIWAGFAVQLLAVTTFWIVGELPPSVVFENQEAFMSILGFLPRIVLASLAAYLFGEFVNAKLVIKIRNYTGEKRMYVRFIGSTVVGQFIDTIIFGLIAFGGILTGSEMIEFVLFGWIFKTLVEVLLLPVTYRVVSFLKTREAI